MRLGDIFNALDGSSAVSYKSTITENHNDIQTIVVIMYHLNDLCEWYRKWDVLYLKSISNGIMVFIGLYIIILSL